jgi:hypothetical protein
MVSLIAMSRLEEIFQSLTPEELNTIDQSLTGIIEEYCNTTFEPVDYVGEILDSRDPMVPDHLPLISVASLIDNDVVFTENIDFWVYQLSIKVKSPSKVNKGVVISYRAGFQTIPQQVKLVAEDLANYWAFKRSEGSQLFYKSQEFEERSYEVQKDFNESRILSRLRRYVQPRPRGSGGIRLGVM